MPPTEPATKAFATFSPYNGWCDLIFSSLTLRLGEANALTVRQQKFLHCMQFCAISPRDLKRVGLSTAGIEHGALLFMSYYNGSRDAYFEGFAKGMWSHMNDVWRFCKRWRMLVSPTSAATAYKNFEEVSKFIEKYERPTASYFSAYPEGSSNVRAALVLRREVDELYALAVADEKGERFQRSFDLLIQRFWGNAA